MPSANVYSKYEHWVLALLLLIFFVVIVRTAWLSDDAYITFRVIDNFVSGFGLRWNVAERVQAYTNALWLFVLATPYYFFRDIYAVSMVVSITLSLAAVALLAYRLTARFHAAVVALVILLFSKAFIEYATSGLENPLGYVLVATFFHVVAADMDERRKSLYLGLLTSALLLTRLDMAILIGPVLLAWFWGGSSRKCFLAFLAGLIPLVAWLVFSAIYYGTPFPNTAYAKLYTGMSWAAAAEQGIAYLGNSLRHDHITVPAILLAIVLSLSRGRADPTWGLGLGLALYLAYIIRIGGDFMSGRFLSVPMFISAIIISRLCPEWFCRKGRNLALAVGALTMVGFTNPDPTVVSGAKYRDKLAGFLTDSRAVTDERAIRFAATGLLASRPDNEPIELGYKRTFDGRKTVVAEAIGMAGYFAGPSVYIIDSVGLADAYLARLPASSYSWIGHFHRPLPRGYEESRATGENKLEDPLLGEYFNKMQLITQAGLFSFDRLQAVIDIGFGSYMEQVRQRYRTLHLDAESNWRRQLDLKMAVNSNAYPFAPVSERVSGNIDRMGFEGDGVVIEGRAPVHGSKMHLLWVFTPGNYNKISMQWKKGPSPDELEFRVDYSPVGGTKNFTGPICLGLSNIDAIFDLAIIRSPFAACNRLLRTGPIE